MKKIILFILLILFVLLYYLVNSSIYDYKKNNLSFIKDIIPINIKQSIKYYFFPYKIIENQKYIIKSILDTNINDKKISYLDINFFEYDINLKESLKNVIFKKSSHKKLLINNNIFSFEIYSSEDKLAAGIDKQYPGSAYLDYIDDKLFLLSKVGITAYAKINQNELNFIQIKNNINEFIGYKQFQKGNWFSVKDLKIIDNKVYVSYTDEKLNNCWNTSIIVADINYENLNFKHLFRSNECIDQFFNEDNEFSAHQSGGKIIDYDENHILLTVGDYRQRKFAQINKSVFGKIIKINLNNINYEIIATGIRNSQGIVYNRDEEIIIFSSQGPHGGDEINLIDLNISKLPNFGWPISSYGEHYGGRIEKNKTKYEKYPLYKSHADYEFIEPIKYFKESIEPSEIIKIKENNYILSSLKAKTLFFFSLTDNKIENFREIYIGERIRDIIIQNNIIYLFLEDTSSIGKIIIHDN